MGHLEYSVDADTDAEVDQLVNEYERRAAVRLEEELDVFIDVSFRIIYTRFDMSVEVEEYVLAVLGWTRDSTTFTMDLF